MNMLLLDPEDVGTPLPRSDRRWIHLHKILKAKLGDELKAGCTDGTIGTARLQSFDERSLVLEYEAKSAAPELYPVTIILGFPRPIQATRIFRELCSLGVSRIVATGTDLGEKSYLESHFVADKAWEHALIEGAEQAGNPRLPEVRLHRSLDRCLATLSGEMTETRIYLHPDPDALRLGAFSVNPEAPIVLAVGSERGWTQRECSLLGSSGFTLASLGSRILKTETAVEAAVVLALAKLGWL